VEPGRGRTRPRRLRALIRDRLALPGYPQMLLQPGPAPTPAPRPPADLTEP
jgi:hypothetical protein